MSVEIRVSIPAGEAAVERPMFCPLTDDGTQSLAEALRDAGNAVLRSYGLQPSLEVGRPLERLRKQGPPVNLVETPRGGW